MRRKERHHDQLAVLIPAAELWPSARTSLGEVPPSASANVTDRNWEVVGIFEHDRRDWKVHADSHYEPLLIA